MSRQIPGNIVNQLSGGALNCNIRGPGQPATGSTRIQCEHGGWRTLIDHAQYHRIDIKEKNKTIRGIDIEFPSRFGPSGVIG